MKKFILLLLFLISAYSSFSSPWLENKLRMSKKLRGDSTATLYDGNYTLMFKDGTVISKGLDLYIISYHATGGDGGLSSTIKALEKKHGPVINGFAPTKEELELEDKNTENKQKAAELQAAKDRKKMILYFIAFFVAVLGAACYLAFSRKKEKREEHDSWLDFTEVVKNNPDMSSVPAKLALKQHPLKGEALIIKMLQDPTMETAAVTMLAKDMKLAKEILNKPEFKNRAIELANKYPAVKDTILEILDDSKQESNEYSLNINSSSGFTISPQEMVKIVAETFTEGKTLYEVDITKEKFRLLINGYEKEETIGELVMAEAKRTGKHYSVILAENPVLERKFLEEVSRGKIVNKRENPLKAITKKIQALGEIDNSEQIEGSDKTA